VILPRIYPILDTELLDKRGIDVAAAAAAFLEGGARILQFRHKGLWNRAVYAAAQAVTGLCQDAGVPLIINDRADFALLLGAGLHLGQDDLPLNDARRLLGANVTIGFSTHNAAQLCAAQQDDIDYIALGPIFSTTSKRKPDPVVGCEELRRCRALTNKGLVAIGGITFENAPEILRAGADSLAIISGLLPESSQSVQGCDAHLQAGQKIPRRTQLCAKFPESRSLRERMEAWQRLVDSV